jgi:LysM repeat protein
MKAQITSLLLAAAVLVPSLEAQTLRGSRASVDRIHRQALNHGLHFYDTSEGVRRAHQRGVFVRLTGNADYALANVSHPYLLPEAETFVVRLAAQYRAACGEKLVVTSAVRPRSLRLANGSDKSVHPTGMAVDLRRPSNARCLTWLRNTLLEIESRGVIEAVEERSPPHFHVAVFPTPYGRYVQGRGASPRVAASERAASRPTTVAVENANGQRYHVRRGDTLWSIARSNNVSVDELKSSNSLRSTRIVAGQVLVIPQAR